jgi:alpha-galactosidase
VGTQFVIPSLVEKRSKSDLTPARETEFEKWLRIYREKMLSKGQYLGQLYDLCFNAPETHVIRKDQTMYYAFFARIPTFRSPDAKRWKGPVELRGLDDRNHSVVDCVTGKSLGTVSKHTAHLPVEFHEHLLLEVRPQ